MREDDLRIVREIPFFSSMSDDHFDQLLHMAYLQRFPDQVQLLREGDTADFLYIVVEGIVELFSSSHRRESAMFVLEPVSTFNLTAVLSDSIYLMSARTLDSARLLMIPAENVRKCMQDDPGFARAMVAELAKRYRLVINTLKEQKLRTGVERLANYLLRASKQAKRAGKIELSQDKRTLAGLLGLTPEYLSRAFNTLGEHGVKVHGSKISLTDINALKAFAKPDPLIDSHEVQTPILK